MERGRKSHERVDSQGTGGVPGGMVSLACFNYCSFGIWGSCGRTGTFAVASSLLSDSTNRLMARRHATTLQRPSESCTLYVAPSSAFAYIVASNLTVVVPVENCQAQGRG